FGPAVQAGEGHAEHVAHGDPDAAPVQRVGAAGAEQDAVDAEGGGVAEDGAEVLVVADAFQHCEAARVGDQVGGLDGRGAVGHGQHSAVEVEADDFGHDFGGGRVGGHVEGGERVCQFVDAAAHSEQGSHRVGGGEESFDDHDSFGYDQSAAAGPVRAAVGSRQVAEVVDPGIVGIGNLDYVRHGGHSPILLHPTVARSPLTRITCGRFRYGLCTAPSVVPLWQSRPHCPAAGR